tara:strand:+ start:298 stop:522 length:225 start_codon:yes stop_codon:yes gene_type:complete
MSKIIKGKKVGAEKFRNLKPPIINEYQNIEDKLLTLPKIIKHDYGFEMQFGIIPTGQTKERNYLYKKHTPEYRK